MRREGKEGRRREGNSGTGGWVGTDTVLAGRKAWRGSGGNGSRTATATPRTPGRRSSRIRPGSRTRATPNIIGRSWARSPTKVSPRGVEAQPLFFSSLRG